MAPTTRASDFDGNLGIFLKDYAYQPTLTPRLDNLGGTEFTQGLVNEIVLWKVNRYVELDRNLLRDIEQIRQLKPREHRQAEWLLASLLRVHGVDLPMASTLLRFRNPAVFQIFDRHAYRAVYGFKSPLSTQSPAAKKISAYFEYLDQLVRLCDRRQLDFATVDRVLYQFDKATNGPLKE